MQVINGKSKVRKWSRKVKNSRKTPAKIPQNRRSYHFRWNDPSGRRKVFLQAIRVQSAAVRQIGIAANPSQHIVIRFAVPAEVVQMILDHRAGQHAQYGRLEGALDAARRHTMDGRILRVVDGDEGALAAARTRLQQRRVLFHLFPAQILPVHLAVEAVIELGRLVDVVLDLFVVADKLDEQIVKHFVDAP